MSGATIISNEEYKDLILKENELEETKKENEKIKEELSTLNKYIEELKELFKKDIVKMFNNSREIYHSLSSIVSNTNIYKHEFEIMFKNTGISELKDEILEKINEEVKVDE